MSRLLNVYPKASIQGSTWTLTVKVSDYTTVSRFVHQIPAGVSVATPLQLLKVVFDVEVGDTVTDADVDSAIFVDDIKRGAGTETVWSNWQAAAEQIVAGLGAAYSEDDFRSAWTRNDTEKLRNDIQRAFVSGPGGMGRGWSIVNVHHHEGDGTVT